MGQQQKLGKTATRVVRVDNYQYVWYHQTAVVIFNAETIRLDSGGWRTATTKSRMNQAANQFGLGYSVYQKAYEWFVSQDGYADTEFYDGMILKR